MNTNIVSQLEQAEKEFAAERQKLEAGFAKKKADLLVKVKTELAQALSNAATIYAAIPETERGGLLKDTSFAPFLSTLGLTVLDYKPRKHKGSKKAHVTDEQILGWIAVPKDTKSIQIQFGLSKVTLSKRLNALLADKKVTVSKSGTSKIWKKA